MVIIKGHLRLISDNQFRLPVPFIMITINENNAVITNKTNEFKCYLKGLCANVDDHVFNLMGIKRLSYVTENYSGQITCTLHILRVLRSVMYE